MEDNQQSAQVADLDVFAPVNAKTIKFNGKQRPIISLMNLSNRQVMRIQNFAKILEATPEDQQFQLITDLIRVCVPSITIDELQDMPISQVGVLYHTILAEYRKEGAKSSDPLVKQPNA